CGSFSERTPQKVSNILVKELGNNPKVYIWDGQEPNPHMGHLACTDAFVVTADSVSMISEACSTGIRFVPPTGSMCILWDLSVFTQCHKSLRDRGVVRPFIGYRKIGVIHPSDDTADAATRVHEALAAQ
ncbi:Mitochondrial fission protein ELM1, partial [Mucuna pruriens]